jgi:hypothetical protein
MLKIGTELKELLKKEILEDTGWITLTPASGYEHYNASNPAKYRILNGVIYFTSGIKPVTGYIPTTENTTITAPNADLVPFRSYQGSETMCAGTTGRQPLRTYIAGDGSIVTRALEDNTNYIVLSGLSGKAEKSGV